MDMHQKYAPLYAEYEEGSTEAGAKAGALLAEARAIAMNEYNASDGYKLELEGQMSMVDRLQQDAALNESYYNAGHALGLKFTEELQSAIDEIESAMFLELGNSLGPSGFMDTGTGAELPRDDLNAFSHADGLRRVPYDDYPAILHRDERILTAAEARGYDSARIGNVNVTVTGKGKVFFRRNTCISRKNNAAWRKKTCHLGMLTFFKHALV